MPEEQLVLLGVLAQVGIQGIQTETCEGFLLSGMAAVKPRPERASVIGPQGGRLEVMVVQSGGEPTQRVPQGNHEAGVGEHPG